MIALMLSGVIPGLGQLYNGDRLKAFLFFAFASLAAFGPWNPLDVDIDLDSPLAGLMQVLVSSLPFLAITLWSVVDAYRVARSKV